MNVCPTTSAVAPIPANGQCGGTLNNYNGSKTCVSGLKCYIQNSVWSVCTQSCPQYWQCQVNEGNGKLNKMNCLQSAILIRTLMFNIPKLIFFLPQTEFYPKFNFLKPM